MKRLATSLCALLVLATTALTAQSSSSSLTLVDSSMSDGSGAVHSMKTMPTSTRGSKPFSQFGLGAGVSPLGIGMSVATNLNEYMNLRGTGNLFNYPVNNFTANGFTVGAKL